MKTVRLIGGAYETPDVIKGSYASDFGGMLGTREAARFFDHFRAVSNLAYYDSMKVLHEHCMLRLSYIMRVMKAEGVTFFRPLDQRMFIEYFRMQFIETVFELFTDHYKLSREIDWSED